MGSIGSNKQVPSNTNTFESLPSTDIKPLKPTKRSEEVFTREYTGLRLLAKSLINEGNLDSSGYSSLHDNDEEAVFSKRMLQGMQSQLNSEWHNFDIDIKLGVTTKEEQLYKRYALSMLQKMLNKYYKNMYGKED